MMDRRIAVSLVLLCIASPAMAGEIILVDPATGTTSVMPSTGVGSDPAIDRRTGADRARERLSPESGSDGVLVIQPGPPAPVGAAEAGRRAARSAAERASGRDGTGFDGDVLLIQPGPPAPVGAAEAGRRAARSAAERAGGHEGGVVDGGVLVIQPGSPVPLGAAEAGRQAARSAAERAGGGHEDGASIGGIDPSVNTIIIIDDGQARVVNPGDRVDNITRMGIDAAKARAYQRGDHPCGSALVGGVEGGGGGTSNAATKDVYVFSNNCR